MREREKGSSICWFTGSPKKWPQLPGLCQADHETPVGSRTSMAGTRQVDHSLLLSRCTFRELDHQKEKNRSSNCCSYKGCAFTTGSLTLPHSASPMLTSLKSHFFPRGCFYSLITYILKGSGICHPLVHLPKARATRVSTSSLPGFACAGARDKGQSQKSNSVTQTEHTGTLSIRLNMQDSQRSFSREHCRP